MKRHCSSPQLPSSFDPAIHLHSEYDPHDCSENHTDEIEGQLLQAQEVALAKTEQKIVIQHRSWQFADVFRSEEDYSIDTPSIKRTRRIASLKSAGIPSSPPLADMPFISSPVQYPATSSPTIPSPRKRRKLSEDGRSKRDPLKVVDGNEGRKAVAGFLLDSDDDEEDDNPELKRKLAKRRAAVDAAAISTPPRSSAEIDLREKTTELPEPVAQHDEEAFLDIDAVLPASTQTRSLGSLHLATAKTASGRSISLAQRRTKAAVSYERLVAARTEVDPNAPRKCYYGLNVHQLMADAAQEEAEKAEQTQSDELEQPRETTETTSGAKGRRTLMWTEKYRAKKFTDLVGDERTHRSVLRWLKAWDPIVFPGAARAKAKGRAATDGSAEEPKQHKILMLTGPPGLGKTTLAHVCAKQAGYEVQEINASDERSHTVVKGRIRDMVGTENVRGIESKTADGKVRKAGKPVCVVVDEVDGVVGGSGGGGEGGFIKALIDLINLDAKNSSMVGQASSGTTTRKRKGDKFRLLRPVILICNDVYHPSLRPLRQSSIAEIVHIRKPPLNMVISRISSIFEKEGITADTDGVRKLCEATWGVSNRKDGGTGSGTGEGDIRGIMVVGEWVAGKLRATKDPANGERRLSKAWIEKHILGDLGHGGGAARSLGRGGAKEVAERVFQENAGFPRTTLAVGKVDLFAIRHEGTIGVAEASKGRAMNRLREMINTSGESDKIVTDCFSSYPTYPYQDDNFLSKPNSAYEWLHFHDAISSQVHVSQEWELAPYLSQATLAFHHLFASNANRPSKMAAMNPQAKAGDNAALEEDEPGAFTGPSAPFAAAEALKQNKAALTALHGSLSTPLARIFRSPTHLSTDLLPFVLRMLAPDVKPVVIQTGSSATSKFSNRSTASVRRASERTLVARAVNAMIATGVRFERSKVEFDMDANRPGGNGGWVYRMEPALDAWGVFETMNGKNNAEAKVRFAVRQVLETEFRREMALREAAERKKRGGVVDLDEAEGPGKKDAAVEIEAAVKAPVVKRDFFGRVLKEDDPGQPATNSKQGKGKGAQAKEDEDGRVWVSFNEGFSNAVRKPLTLKELMAGF